ncbi:MAG: histidinol dehydrogenase [Candidatus Latescibacteria bacterium]|nr:histidinol dehydrogenase [Candidatus Latescibacterota bacterium]
MIEILSYPATPLPAKLQAILGRQQRIPAPVEQTVRQVLEAVRTRGDEALAEFTAQFDRVKLRPEQFRVPAPVLAQALAQLDPALRQAIEAAAANIRAFHERQKVNSWFMEDGDGVILGKKVLPIGRVGICVPGGQAPLFSSLLMAAIPAQVAGVKELCVVSPPQADGWPHATILATAQLLGLTEVYALGGAQAVGAMAFGTATVKGVDKIVGPGSLYTVAAKQQVYGVVGIEMIPGPSELVVLADEQADPRYVAADLLSQAEHGSGYEAVVCITPSAALAARVQQAVEAQLARLPRAAEARLALENFGALVVVPDLSVGVELLNRLAPEHAELLVQDPWSWVEQIKNAGALFLGAAATEPVGDYFAGTNHVLPTNGAARFSSSLGVADFLKTTSIIAYTAGRLNKVGDQIIRLAEAEGFAAHAEAVRLRLEDYRSKS